MAVLRDDGPCPRQELPRRTAERRAQRRRRHASQWCGRAPATDLPTMLSTSAPAAATAPRLSPVAYEPEKTGGPQDASGDGRHLVRGRVLFGRGRRDGPKQNGRRG